MWFVISIVFVFGVANFALHSAVLDSRHPMLDQMPGFVRKLGGRLTLVAEFIILLAAMLLVANGWPEMVWGYGAYTGFNCLAAYLMLKDKV